MMRREGLLPSNERTSAASSYSSKPTDSRFTTSCRQECHCEQNQGTAGQCTTEIINVTECESSIEVISSPESNLSSESDRDAHSHEQV